MDFASQLSKMWRYQYFKGEPNVRRPIPGGRVTVMVSLSAILVLGLSRLGGATTINANSASQSDVAAAIASAINGDIIIMPGGTVSWTRTLRVKKAITIQGAGVGVTIIKDSVQNGRLIDWTLVAGLPSRLTGIEFQDGGRVATALAPGGILHVDGSNTDGSTFRWDHCKWNNLNGFPVMDTVIGVIDHNEIIIGGKTHEWLFPYGSHWNGGNYGDGSWAAPADWGSSQFLFLEDNTFTNLDKIFQVQVIDVYGGGRVVVRHNVIRGGQTSNHGTESTGRTRSARAMEIYDNQISCNNLNKYAGGNRGGGELFYNNTITACWGNLAEHSLATHRIFYAFPTWGGADGTNGWDKNAPGAPFYTGTATGAGNLSVTVDGANWTPNQWVGYSIKRNAGGFSYITGNTATMINFSDGGGYGGGKNLTFSAGDSFTINKVDQAIDQPGVGQSTLLRGDNPTPPPGWNQVVEPCYMWGNTNDGQPFNRFSAHQANVKPGVHYFNNTMLPGYTPYVYPHPLTTGQPLSLPTHSATPSSQRHLSKVKEEKAKRIKTWKWGRAKEKAD
jgi:hypothetical protein